MTVLCLKKVTNGSWTLEWSTMYERQNTTLHLDILIFSRKKRFDDIPIYTDVTCGYGCTATEMKLYIISKLLSCQSCCYTVLL